MVAMIMMMMMMMMMMSSMTHVSASKRRWTSNQPEHTVYSGPKDSAAESNARVTLSTLRKKFAAGTPITVVTAYDYPSAVHVDSAGIVRSILRWLSRGRGAIL